jgi:hypothetical protein
VAIAPARARIPLTIVAAVLAATALLLSMAPGRADAGGVTSAFLVAEMTGAEEVPTPGDPDGAGLATVDVDAGAGEICYTLVVGNIATANAAHIHIGGAGTAGAPVVTLETPDASGFAEACQAIDPTLAQQIIDNPAGYYVNVHNVDYPAGAIRGQLAAPVGGCALFASTDDAPIPTSTLSVTVGETVLLEGLMQPNATVVLSLAHEGTPAGTSEFTTDEFGYFAAELVFEPGDELTWTVTAVVPETECAGSVTLTVGSGGPVRTVTVVKYVCADELPADIDLDNLPSGCQNVVLPGDEPDLGDNSAPTFGGAAAFDVVLTEPGGERSVTADATLDGGFTCDPSTQTCVGGLAYRFDFVPVGQITLEETTVPSGSTLGAVIVVDASEKGASSLRVDLRDVEGPVIVPEGLDGDVRAVFFNVESDDAAPAPSPSAPGSGELPDTAVRAAPATRMSPEVVLALAITVVAGGTLLARSRRRPTAPR